MNQRRLIEVGLPLRAVSRESVREKNIHARLLLVPASFQPRVAVPPLKTWNLEQGTGVA